MTRALLLGKEPGMELGFQYVREQPYEAVVIGSLSLSQLLRFREEQVLTALAEGKPVYLYTPGLPEAPRNRALAGSLTAAQRRCEGQPRNPAPGREGLCDTGRGSDCRPAAHPPDPRGREKVRRSG